MRLEIGLAATPVGDVRVQLGGRQVCVAEHLLDGAQVGPSFEQVGRERVPEQVRVDAPGLEPGLVGELAQDQKRPARVSGPPFAFRKSSARKRRSR